MKTSGAGILDSARASCEFDRLSQHEEILAYLPMAWVGDFIFAIGQAYWAGFTTNCPESAATMMTDLREIGPTYFFAPPRVFEARLPSPGVEVRIGETGEVFYRSPGTFVEYYNNPESTASTKDAEGWVATGDAGFFEEGSGHLRIIDRAKDVGKMASGALYVPKYVENKLKFFPAILEAVVFGRDRKMCTAMINIDLGAVGAWAERNNISYASYQELAAHPKVCEMIRGHVEEVNRSVAADPVLAGCQIHRFLVLHKELDADDGEMTRTRKVRRAIIETKFADLIGALYDGSTSIATETDVTYEDGRHGTIKATLRISDAAVVADAGERMAAE